MCIRDRVNNAGYAIPTPFDQTSMEEEEKFIRVLALAVIALTKLFIRDMLKAREGKIMMISSVAAYAPPSIIQTLYGPVKTFVNRFSEGININYNDIGITSTAVCPGYTVTNFHKASGVQEEMDRVPSFMKKTPHSVAKEAVNATLRGKKVCIPGKTFKLIVFFFHPLNGYRLLVGGWGAVIGLNPPGLAPPPPVVCGRGSCVIIAITMITVMIMIMMMTIIRTCRIMSNYTRTSQKKTK